MIDVISKALPIVAAAYARKFGLKIVVGGDSAHTTGDYIQLPAIPEDYPYKDAIWGFLAHEAAHVRHTDFEEFGARSTDEFKQSIGNALEDGRIESAFVRRYPGAKQTLDEALRLFIAQGSMQEVSADSHPAAILDAYILYYVRNQFLRQEALDKQYASARQALETTFPENIVRDLDLILARVNQPQSTREVFDMADLIMLLFKQDAENEPQPEPGKEENPESGAGDQQREQEQSEGQGGDRDQGSDDSNELPGEAGRSDESGDSGEQGQSGSGSKGDSKESDSNDPQGNSGKGGDQSEGDSQNEGGAGGSGGDSSGEPQQQSGKDQAGGDSSKGDGSQQGQKDGQPVRGGEQSEGGYGDAKRNVQRVVLEASAEHVHRDVFEVMRDDFEKAAANSPSPCGTLPQAVSVVPGSDAEAEAVAGEAATTTVALRKQLMALVEAKDRVHRRYLDRGRKVAANRLSGVAAGNMRVFKHQKKAQRVNTAFHLLVDASASMDTNGAMGTANSAALSLALALEALPRVSVAVSAFQGNHVEEMLKHGQSAKRNAHRFCVRANGGTPMAEALWHAAADLVQRREERKIIILITDGAPRNAPQTQHVVDLVKRSGYEVMAVGIKSTAVARFVDDFCVIEKVQDLRTRLFDIVKGKLAA